jgi:hypothetical protein
VLAPTGVVVISTVQIMWLLQDSDKVINLYSVFYNSLIQIPRRT